MEELRPLIPVLEAYKADTLLVKQFREEVANVTELLGNLQEQLGGLDYQDLHSRVMSLEDRLRACMQRLGESLGDGVKGHGVSDLAGFGEANPLRARRWSLCSSLWEANWNFRANYHQDVGISLWFLDDGPVGANR